MKRSLLVLAFLALSAAATAGPVVIKMGTRAPDGSSWHLLLKKMGERWREASDGLVELRIYPGGVAGDEPDMVRALRIGKLHASALTIVGLSLISPESQVLSVPQLLTSYAELDHVRERIAPKLEEKLTEKGFVVLNWGDGGWVHFMTTKPAVTPDDVRKLKVFVWAGDAITLDLYKDSGFTPVSLASTDILPALQTGLIEAVPTTPLIADATQMFTVAKHMVGHQWGPLVGATIVSTKKWEEIPAAIRPKLLAIAKETGEALKSEIRAQDAAAVDALIKRGVTVHPVDAAGARAWQEVAERTYGRIRGGLVPPEVFDEVKRLRDAYRAGAGATSSGAAAKR